MKIVKVLPLVAAMMLTGCVSMSPFYDRPQAPVAGAWPEGAAYEQAKLNEVALPDWEALVPFLSPFLCRSTKKWHQIKPRTRAEGTV